VSLNNTEKETKTEEVKEAHTKLYKDEFYKLYFPPKHCKCNQIKDGTGGLVTMLEKDKKCTQNFSHKV
jgi:hypothetical protein